MTAWKSSVASMQAALRRVVDIGAADPQRGDLDQSQIDLAPPHAAAAVR